MSKIKKGIMSVPSGTTGSIITFQRLGKSIVTGKKKGYVFRPNSRNELQYQKVELLYDFYDNLDSSFREILYGRTIQGLSGFNIFMKYNKYLITDNLTVDLSKLVLGYPSISDPEGYAIAQNPFNKWVFFIGQKVANVGLNPSNYWIINYNKNVSTGVVNQYIQGWSGNDYSIIYDPWDVPSGEVISHSFQLFNPITFRSTHPKYIEFTK